MNIHTRLAIINYKIRGIPNKLKIAYLKLLGLTLGKKCKIGKITCDWPQKVSIGNSCEIQDGVDFRIGTPFKEECRITVDDNTFIGRYCELNCSSTIAIGKNCLIASNTSIVDVYHKITPPDILLNSGTYTRPITIEDDVWIGTHCVILNGVTIGQGSIVAAGALVNKSIPPYEVWGGIPAKFIKKRQ